jgi:hypothetical protein
VGAQKTKKTGILVRPPDRSWHSKPFFACRAVNFEIDSGKNDRMMIVLPQNLKITSKTFSGRRLLSTVRHKDSILMPCRAFQGLRIESLCLAEQNMPSGLNPDTIPCSVRPES